ncbi:MAG: DUF3179 domain-containing (seleno)protein [Alphaproteobacteria bacterium]|nr:DUF3179 domain-containing (seleno)protein [Alphaproteobacteria bacterium]
MRLKTRPLAIATWADWRRANPTTTVLSLDTGQARDYGSGVVYKDYFASPNPNGHCWRRDCMVVSISVECDSWLGFVQIAERQMSKMRYHKIRATQGGRR